MNAQQRSDTIKRTVKRDWKQNEYDDNHRDELNKKHRENYAKLKSQD
ncbi:hypothetical protein Plhal304r1_c024g0082591 [Plasmopara halstedii]